MPFDYKKSHCCESGKEYPLHSRYELKSLYDPDRRTFIYDIGKYEQGIGCHRFPGNKGESGNADKCCPDAEQGYYSCKVVLI